MAWVVTFICRVGCPKASVVDKVYLPTLFYYTNPSWGRGWQKTILNENKIFSDCPGSLFIFKRPGSGAILCSFQRIGRLVAI